MKKTTFLIFLTFFPILCQAEDKVQVIYPNPTCLLDVTSRAKIPFTVFLAIMRTEGGRVGMVKRNRNGSHDLGVMQVNDQAWLRKIAYMDFNGDMKKAREKLIYDGCYNMKISAMIYRNYIDEAGGIDNPNSIAIAVGHYNSHTPEKMARYMNMVAPNFRRVLRDLDSEK